MNRTERNVIRWALMVGALAGMVGCAHGGPVAVEQTETVGTLAAGPSVYTAPLKHDLPPSLAFVPGSGDDDVSAVATTVSRVDAGEADAAPEVVGKGGGLTAGEVRQ